MARDADTSAPEDVPPVGVSASVKEFLLTSEGRRRAAGAIARSVIVWAALEAAETTTPTELRAGLSAAEAERRLNAMLANDRFLSLAMAQAIQEETVLLRVVISRGRSGKPGQFGVKEAGREYRSGGLGEDGAGLATAALPRSPRAAVPPLAGVPG